MTRIRGAAWIIGAFVVGALTALPQVTSNRSALTWGFLVLLYAALAQSWNLLGGLAGQISLGHAAFFGLGAFVTRVLWLGGHSLATALAAGTAVAVAAGVLIGAPTLRLRGPYFAIGTLAARALAGYALAPRYYLALGAAVVSTLVVWALARSRFGYGLAAVREDEDVAEAIGVHVFRHKLAVFVLSSALAGATGGVFGYYHLSFCPQFVFSPLWTFDALLITFLGGAGTMWGPPLGAMFYLVFREALALRLVEVHLLIFGALFVLVVLAFPGGLIEAWRMFASRWIAVRERGG